MSKALDDPDTWILYPHHRKWFDKLWVATEFGLSCGPGGVPVPIAAEYVVRPIMNLRGMGIGAEIKFIEPSNLDAVPPGYFWCERLIGKQYSHEFTWGKTHWKKTSSWLGENSPENLSRFHRWTRVNIDFELPKCMNVLWDCGSINVETIGNTIIEVHLRPTPNPTNYDELIPVWKDIHSETYEGLKETHTFVSGIIDDAYSPQRLGFYCR